MVSRESHCISMLPLWFRTNSGLSWPLQAFCGGPLRLPTATARAVRRDLNFDAPAEISREWPLVTSSGLFPLGHFVCRPQRRARRDGALVSTLSHEFRCVSMLPLWFCALLRLPTATVRAVGRVLGFDAPVVISREFPCDPMLPLWFRANSVVFRCSPYGFGRIPASRGLFRPLLWGPLRLLTATARTVRRDLGFDARAVVSHEFRCISMLPL